ncbi:unnamed protein product [Microthlaspi erraticum]|uniref:Arabidopsis retrotransposon Orf1 C-terminal domain-containing protein n=1 Tax=Microthlaspi erraticum TaxID=1685480 RepID=A0A6D2L918_9BRAS|nr:unnamed protein product [Microthlaspi erraticum]
MQADLERMTQRMEESDAEEYVYSEEESESERLREERRTKKRNDPISSESEQGEFEIGVNLVQEEGSGSPSEEGSDETESEEEGEEVNQLVEESEQESNQDEPMEEVEPQESHKRRKKNSLYVELVLKNMHLAKLFSYHMESYKELTCEFLASMRQLEILFGFNYGEGTKWNFKEKELQREPSVEICAQGTCQHLLCKEGTGTINEGELKFLDMGIKPILSRTSDGKRIRGDRSNTGNLMPFLDHLLTYKTTAYNTRHQRGRRLSVGGLITPILCAAGVNPTDKKPLNQVGWTSSFARPTFSLSTRSWMGVPIQVHHPLAGPSKLLLPNPELTTGVRTLISDPLCTLVGHEDDLREEEPELDRAEDRAESQAEDRVQESGFG